MQRSARQKPRGAWVVVATILVLAPGAGCKKDSSAAPWVDDCDTGTNQVEQNGVTFRFSACHTVGQYANGDTWVLGPVEVVQILPEVELSLREGATDLCDGFTAGNEACAAWCADHGSASQTSRCSDDDRCFCSRVRHGWEVNPAYDPGQGFDDRAGSFNGALVPELPYTAVGGESLVKAVSISPTEPDPRPSLERAAVLTVVDEIPPGHGADVFRPPYVGTDKTTYYVSELRTDLLPGYASVDETPTLQSIAERFGPLQLDHQGGATNRYLHPSEHMPDYGCDIGRDIGDGALRLMLDDALEDKLPALVAFVQMGIDLHYAARLGQTWPAGGGHQTGRKLAIVFAATLLDDAQMLSDAASWDFFEEDTGIYYSDVAGVPLYGYTIFSYSEEAYWERLVNDGGNKAHADPYGHIDGGWLDGGNYQGIVSPTFKGAALALHLMPELRQVWDNPHFLNYVDRWVNLGFWTQPDPCAPEGDWADYGSSYGPDGAGGCQLDADPGDGTGRFPELHATGADGPNRRSAFQGHLWDAYRGSTCYDEVCDTDEDAQTCPYDCP